MRRVLLACWGICWLACAALPGVAQAREVAANPAPTPASINSAELPAEARETLRLIERGGPFPYPRDGVVFGNRERLLPLKPHGTYHEYTVPTPGRRDRGARRIVTGAANERYYSEDHYRSFRQIRE